MASHWGKAHQYIADVLSGKQPACKWVRAACERQIRDLARQGDKGWPYRFDLAKAGRICKFIERLPHIKGKWGGTPIVLEPWQCFVLGTVFGWVRKDTGLRRFRTVFCEIPRKNAKSTLSSGVGLYMLTADDEPGADVYSAATTRDQAKIVFADAQAMARKEPELREAFGVAVNAHNINVLNTSSKFEALSADAHTLDGLNIHCAIVDELHAHKTRDVWEVIETATGARSQPLIWSITTAGSNRAGICYEQRTYVTKILDRVAEDESYFGVIYTIDPEPHTSILHEVPALEELEKACTCKHVQPIQIEKFWREACAQHATTDGGRQKTGSGVAKGIATDLLTAEAYVKSVTSSSCSTKIPSIGSGSTPGSESGRRITQPELRPQATGGGASLSLPIESFTSNAKPSTESRESNTTLSIWRSAESVPSAISFKSVYQWITATGQALFADCSAADAIRQSAFSATLKRAYNAHSTTCGVREIQLDGSRLSVKRPGDDWASEESWKKANPNYGVSVNPDDLARKAAKALQMASAVNGFLTKHLNFWCSQDTAWMDMRAWDRCKDEALDIEDFTNDPCWIALDLATKTDIAAMALLFKRGADYYVFGRYYVPQETVENSSNSQYSGWERTGKLIATPGAVTDFAVIENDVLELCGRFKVQEIAKDPWQSAYLGTRLQDQGLTVVDVRQTVQMMSAPMKELESLVLSGKFHHDGDPVLAWMASNVVAHLDNKENIYPKKERPENKIDGIIALIMGLNRALVSDSENRPSVYESRGLLTA